jgi:hypothetical protein
MLTEMVIETVRVIETTTEIEIEMGREIDGPSNSKYHSDHCSKSPTPYHEGVLV